MTPMTLTAASRYPRTCRGKHGPHTIEGPEDERSGCCLECLRINGRNRYRERHGIPLDAPLHNGRQDQPVVKLMRNARRLEPAEMDDGQRQHTGCLVVEDFARNPDGYVALQAGKAHRVIVEHFMAKAGDTRLQEDGRLHPTWEVHHSCLGHVGRRHCIELSHLHVWSKHVHNHHHGRNGSARGLANANAKEFCKRGHPLYGPLADLRPRAHRTCAPCGRILAARSGTRRWGRKRGLPEDEIERRALAAEKRAEARESARLAMRREELSRGETEDGQAA